MQRYISGLFAKLYTVTSSPSVAHSAFMQRFILQYLWDSVVWLMAVPGSLPRGAAAFHKLTACEIPSGPTRGVYNHICSIFYKPAHG